jgi:catechol 2,3-dioxygenase-like lactoylglutathione lyase family enzyme
MNNNKHEHQQAVPPSQITLSKWISGMPYHVGIEVPDMEEALRFYVGVLGFKLDWREQFGGPLIEKLSGIPGASEDCAQLLVPGGSRLELQQYKPQGRIGYNSVNNQGLNHLSFGVTDVRAVYDYLIAAGVKVACEPIDMVGWHGGCTVFYFSDPWGTILEFLGPMKGENPDFGEVAGPSWDSIPPSIWNAKPR